MNEALAAEILRVPACREGQNDSTLQLSAWDGGLVLETARMRLLPWAGEDWPSLRPLARDSEVMRYISGGALWSDERIREFAEKQIKCFAERQFCNWRLVHKESGEMIGFCGLQPWDDGQEIEIGWWLARDRWNQGLATEAAREALRDGFERAGLKRIVSVAMPENRASIHIMEKLGMRFERETTRRGFAVVVYAMERRAAEYS